MKRSDAGLLLAALLFIVALLILRAPVPLWS
jgi:hypothetical protein